jgi:hypothetical protein
VQELKEEAKLVPMVAERKGIWAAKAIRKKDF